MNAPFGHQGNFRILIDERVLEEMRSLDDHDRNRVLTAIQLANYAPVLAKVSDSELRFIVMYDGVFLLIDFAKLEETFVIRAFLDDFDGEDPLPPSSTKSLRTNLETVLGAIGVDVRVHVEAIEDKSFNSSTEGRSPSEEQPRIFAPPAVGGALAPCEVAIGTSDEVTREAKLPSSPSYVTTLVSAYVAIRPLRALSLFAAEENPERSSSTSARPIP